MERENLIILCKEIREETGCGMMEIKMKLIELNYDKQKAIEYFTSKEFKRKYIL